jgi:hypothetical protein
MNLHPEIRHPRPQIMPLSSVERAELRRDQRLSQFIRSRAYGTLRRRLPDLPDIWGDCRQTPVLLPAAKIPDHVRDAIESAPEPLAPATRRRFERLLGTSLSRVRVLHGSVARSSTARLNVAAYTFGDRIVLGDRALAEDSDGIDWILAHEFAHVLQQSPLADRSQGPVTRGTLERQADSLADSLTGSGYPPMSIRLLAAPAGSLLLNPIWARCSSLCAGAGGGLEGMFFDFKTGVRTICQITDCGRTFTPAVRARGWCVYSCAGEGKKYAVFFINTVCGFVGPYYVF